MPWTTQSERTSSGHQPRGRNTISECSSPQMTPRVAEVRLSSATAAYPSQRRDVLWLLKEAESRLAERQIRRKTPSKANTSRPTSTSIDPQTIPLSSLPAHSIQTVQAFLYQHYENQIGGFILSLQARPASTKTTKTVPPGHYYSTSAPSATPPLSVSDGTIIPADRAILPRATTSTYEPPSPPHLSRKLLHDPPHN